MGNLAPNQSPALAALATALRAAADVIETLPPSEGPSDELRPIVDFADEFGLERRGLKAALRRASVKTVKIGRSPSCRRSDVISLVERLAAKEEPAAVNDIEADYAALTRAARGGR